ncbi:O-antigen ligase family protein [Sphingomonas sp. Leaf21]|uniref:O-antigen ligase family protein n=1 Tax=Sphingomonas sp. Leaf21 TaxID=2876550 RepID=UPI001E28D7D6|nr:O-antigen ligase family protein [Sphingomonas sp. Leaf21]
MAQIPHRSADPESDRAPSQAGRGRRMPEWAPPLLALLIFAQIGWGGANQGVSSALAACADALLAIVVIGTSPAASRFWHQARVPVGWFVAALVWGALPILLPDGLARALDIPVNPAADMAVLALAKALGTTLLLITAALLAYSGGSAAVITRWLAFAALLLLLYAAADAVDWLYDSARNARYGGTIGNPNAAGITFAVIALLTGGLTLAPPGAESFAMRLVGMAGAAAALILGAMTGSRSAMLLALILGGMMLFRRLRRWQDGRPSLRRLVPGVVVLVAVAATIAFLTPVGDRSAYLPEDAGSRWAVIVHFAAIASQQPLWGHGLGSFFDVNQHTLNPDTAPLYWNFGAAHNAPVQVALETGWVGLALLLAGFAALLWRIARARRDWWAVPALCGAGAIAGSAMVDIALNVPAVAGLFAVLLGSVWGAAMAPGAMSMTRRIKPKRKAHRHRRSAHDVDQPVVETAV